MSGVTGIELGPNCCVLVRADGRVAADRLGGLRDRCRRHGLTIRTRSSSGSGEARQRAICPAARASWPGASTRRSRRSSKPGSRSPRCFRRRRRCARVVRARQVGAPRPERAVAALSLNSHGARDCDRLRDRGHLLAGVRVAARDAVTGAALRAARSLSPGVADCAAAPARHRSGPSCLRRDRHFRRRCAATCRTCARSRCCSSTRWTSRSRRSTRRTCSIRACPPERSTTRLRRSSSRRPLPRRARTRAGSRASNRRTQPLASSESRAERSAMLSAHASDSCGARRARILHGVGVLQVSGSSPALPVFPDGLEEVVWSRPLQCGRTLGRSHDGTRQSHGRTPTSGLRPTAAADQHRRAPARGRRRTIPSSVRRWHHDRRHPPPRDRRRHRRRPRRPRRGRAPSPESNGTASCSGNPPDERFTWRSGCENPRPSVRERLEPR